MGSSSSTRSATHAGSWYTNNSDKLRRELNGYLEMAEKTLPKDSLLKSLIAPHAGYSYSGPTAAWAYINIDSTKYKRVFLLGPSHHAYLDEWALTQFTEYETPFGNIKIDVDTVKELKDKGDFKYFDSNSDEKEHSLEMHLPFIKRMFGDNEFKLVPIVVGSIDNKKEK